MGTQRRQTLPSFWCCHMKLKEDGAEIACTSASMLFLLIYLENIAQVPIQQRKQRLKMVCAIALPYQGLLCMERWEWNHHCCQESVTRGSRSREGSDVLSTTWAQRGFDGGHEIWWGTFVLKVSDLSRRPQALEDQNEAKKCKVGATQVT